MINRRARINRVMSLTLEQCRINLDVLNANNNALERIDEILIKSADRLVDEETICVYGINNLTVTHDDVISFEFVFIPIFDAPVGMMMFSTNDVLPTSPKTESFNDAFDRAMRSIL